LPCFLLLGAVQLSDEGNEYGVKAMFVYNFTKHVEWPSSANTGVFRIGIVGKSEISDELRKIALQRKVDGKPIEIAAVMPDDNQVYQLIFVSHNQSQKLEELSKKYAGKGVLIISEEAKRSERAASINLIMLDHKVRFEINQTSVRLAGLKISMALSNLASVVNP